MAYPFAPMPTLGGFVDRATSVYGAEIMDIDGISDPNGKYVKCGHPKQMDCQCYGKIHAGERTEKEK